MHTTRRYLLPLAATLAFGGGHALAQDFLINEIRRDQSGADDDEFFELVATGANTSLDGLTYVVIGDGAGGSGVIESITDLTGQSTVGGFFVAAEATFTLGTADLVANLNFENSDNVTHLLVSGFTGASADDLDTDDDGVLDVTPWTSVLDSLGLVDANTPGSGEDWVYSSTVVGPDGTFDPAQVYRCGDSWRIGAFDASMGNDTPGAANDCAPANNDCANAEAVTVGTFMGTLQDATNDGTATCGLSSGSPDIWYSFTADCNGMLTVSTCGTHDLAGEDTGVDTVLSVLDACGGTELACNDDAAGDGCGDLDQGAGRDSRITGLALAMGETVLIRVSNFNSSATGPTVLNVEFACDPDEVDFCFGDGSGVKCPCGNNGLTGNGCAHGSNLDGANLSSSGTASVATDDVVLLATGLPQPNPTFCLFFQGDAQENNGAGTPFGDGLRCVSGNIIRLATKMTSNGQASYPEEGDASVSVKGMVPAGGAELFYQGWFRNVVGPCGQGFNLTNGRAITWMP